MQHRQRTSKNGESKANEQYRALVERRRTECCLDKKRVVLLRRRHSKPGCIGTVEFAAVSVVGTCGCIARSSSICVGVITLREEVHHVSCGVQMMLVKQSRGVYGQRERLRVGWRAATSRAFSRPPPLFFRSWGSGGRNGRIPFGDLVTCTACARLVFLYRVMKPGFHDLEGRESEFYERDRHWAPPV